MNDLNHSDLEYLSFLTRKGLHAQVRALLGDPFALRGSLVASSNLRRMNAAVRHIRRDSQDPSPGFMIDLHLLTHLLLFRAGRPPWLRKWIEEEVALETLFPGMTLEGMLGADWAAVPVPVVLQRARVVWFIAGAVRGRASRVWPPWADALLDEECRSAIEGAATAAFSILPAAAARHPCCYPLLPAGDTIQLRGSSLGLGLALGFLGSAKGAPMPRHVIASGSLSGCHAVGGAESLSKKIACADRKGFGLFLYPSCATPPRLSPRLELLPVATLQEAWMFAGLHAPGRSGELVQLSRMLGDPEFFVNNADMVEPAWLEWVRREGVIGPGHIRGAHSGFARLVEKIGWSTRNWRLDRAAAMASLVSPGGFDAMVSSSPLTALRFCTQKIALANHRGDVAGAESWSAKGERVFDLAMKADIDACADFLNNRFVSRHNRYDFSQIFSSQLTSILQALEDRHAAKCRAGCMVDRVLGEIYGSICQNYGFCGSHHISQCVDYARKALQAFGGEEISELREDALRQHCYLAYAELDAGSWEKARYELFRYFEAGGWGDLWVKLEGSGLSRWQHALLARFLADTANHPAGKRYLNWSLRNRSRTADPGHPWQVWLFNLGRIANGLGRQKDAATLWNESLRFCLAKEGGPTIQVMALLPLSGLVTVGCLSGADMAGPKSQIMDAAEVLNPGYFQVLRRAAFKRVLQQVWERPGELFPFTCR